jgi:DNA adenine methylase
MSYKDHKDLLDFLNTLKGMVVLCGYENPLYSYIGWETKTKKTFADGARPRVETLWFNRQAWGVLFEKWKSEF